MSSHSSTGPHLQLSSRGTWVLLWRTQGGTHKRTSMRTRDRQQAEERAERWLQHLRNLPGDSGLRVWELDEAAWQVWIGRHARAMSYAAGYKGSPVDTIKDELREVLKRQGFRCAISGIVLAPTAPLVDTDEGRRHYPWLAVVMRLPGVDTWASGRWRIVSSLAAAAAVYGDEALADFAAGVITTRGRLGQYGRK